MTENIIEVNKDSFQKSVLEAQKPILVDFWAPWCGPCKAVAPVIEELAKEYQGKVDFAKVNVDDSPFIASKFNVMSIPTLILFKDGKPTEQVVGFKPKDQIKKLIDKTVPQ